MGGWAFFNISRKHFQADKQASRRETLVSSLWSAQQLAYSLAAQYVSSPGEESGLLQAELRALQTEHALLQEQHADTRDRDRRQFTVSVTESDP